MAKFGIGVGEEFPVDEARPPEPPPPNELERRRRHWRRFRFLHLLTRIAVLALIVSGIVWLFRPRAYFYPDPYLLPYGPYPHHFFFPFFPLLLIGLLIAVAWHRRGCYGMHRWHGPDDDHRRGEGA